MSVLAGQHSFVGYGFGNPGNLVINVDAMDSVVVNDDDTVTFGAGARVGPVATALWEANGHVVPHVRGSSVGMIGSYIGGGFGITSRFLGMPFDSMVRFLMKLVYFEACPLFKTSLGQEACALSKQVSDR